MPKNAFGRLFAIILTTASIYSCTAPGNKSKNPPPPEKPPAQMYRANPQRTGVYQTKGVPQLNEIFWKFKAEIAALSPTVSEGVFYFPAQDGFFYVIDTASGEEKWRFSLQLQEESVICTSPAIAEGVVYFGCDGTPLYAVDVNTGQEKWRLDMPVYFSSPAVVDDTIYLGGKNEYLYAINAKTGQKKWRFNWFKKVFTEELEGNPFPGAPVISGETVYFGTLEGYLLAIDRKTGQEKWNFQLPKPEDLEPEDLEEGDEKFRFYLGSSTPSANNSTIYLVAGKTVYAVNAQTAQEKWRFRVTDSFLFHISPTLTQELILFGSNDGILYALNLKTGQEVWQFDGRWIETSIYFSTSTVADGLVYFSNDDTLYVLALNTGEEKWKFKTQGDIYGSVIADGVLYFGSEDGFIYALR